MRKLLVIMCLISLLTVNGYATEPFPTEEYVSKTGRYCVVLSPVLRGDRPDSQSLILTDKTENKDYSFSVEQFNLDSVLPNMIMTTGGLGWYRNSIAVFNEEERYFVIKLPWPQYVVLDLQKHVVVKDAPVEILSDAQNLMSELALKWLDSEDAYKRQTGAIVCKDLKISKGIPRLKELLSDKEFYTKYSGDINKGTIILYVRRAAKEALLTLGEKVENVITELPEKDCLKYDDTLARYAIDWQKSECQESK